MSIDTFFDPANFVQPAGVSEEFPVVFRIGEEIWVDFRKKSITNSSGDQIGFTPKEYSLFALLAHHACQRDTADPLPWAQINKALWGTETLESNILRVHLNAVRNKFDPYVEHLKIMTVPRKGLKIAMKDGTKPKIYAPE